MKKCMTLAGFQKCKLRLRKCMHAMRNDNQCLLDSSKQIVDLILNHATIRSPSFLRRQSLILGFMASLAFSCLLPFFFLAFLLLYVRPCNCGEVSFDQNYYNNWGSHHFSFVNNGREVRLTIDKYSGLYIILIAIYGGPPLYHAF